MKSYILGIFNIIVLLLLVTAYTFDIELAGWGDLFYLSSVCYIVTYICYKRKILGDADDVCV